MWDPWADSQAAEELQRRLKWFLLGRVAITSCFLGVFAASYLGSGEDRYAVPVNRLLLAIIVIYAFSAASAIVLPRIRRLDLYSHVQVAFDTAIITGTVYLTGGTASPFGFLYSLPIINSAVLLFSGGAFIAAALAAIFYDSLMFLLLAGITPSATDLAAPVGFDLQIGLRLATMNGTFFLIAYLAGILTSRLNTTERLLLERQAERDYLSTVKEILARAVDSGLITTDQDRHITSADQIAQELIGRSQEELIGTDIGTTFPPLHLTASARLRLLQSGAGTEPIEFRHSSTSGEEFDLRCVVATLKDTYGHPIGALYVLQNVTEINELATEPVEPEELKAAWAAQRERADEMTTQDGLYGSSIAMCQIRDTIRRVAQSDATVLIGGESGTGKELVARAIHTNSPRRDKPFVAINCGAIPESLIESELFGHVRGAFTGAVSNRAGCFRSADGGSIFLDEIGDLPIQLQAKLLRVLQERVFRPVGSETSVAVNVRVIAASNRDLRARAETGQFREDLFFRLNVIAIEVPPLRERRDDIPRLAHHFLRQFADLHGRNVTQLSPGAGHVLMEYDYPGNVRELENIIEHAVAMCEGETAGEEDLPLYITAGEGPKLERAPAPEPVPAASLGSVPRPEPPRLEPGEAFDLERDLAEFEKAILLRALEQAGGVKKHAAELLGINYRSLRHRLQKYGLGAGDSSA